MLKQTLKKILLLLIAVFVFITPWFSNAMMLSAKTSPKKVKKYIAKQDGSQIGGTQGNIDYGVVYDEYFDTLSFVFISYTDKTKTDYDIILRLDMPSNMKGKGDISIAFKGKDIELSAKGKFKIAKCERSKTIKFKISDNDGKNCSSEEDLQTGFRYVFDAGMALWDKCLYEEIGYGLESCGIKKFITFASDKVVISDGIYYSGYECYYCDKATNEELTKIFKSGEEFKTWLDAAESEDSPYLVEGWGTYAWSEPGRGVIFDWSEIVEPLLKYARK